MKPFRVLPCLALMEIAVAKGGRVFCVERPGVVTLCRPETWTAQVVGKRLGLEILTSA